MLSTDQKREFVEEGYIQIPALVPESMMKPALRAINHSIGEVGATGDDRKNFRVAGFCAELVTSPILTDIINRTPILEVAEELLGKGNVSPVPYVQIAPRFPLAVGKEPEPDNGHLDGIGSGTNGTPKGEYIRNFSLFVVVYLVDVTEPESGNFTVWPHSHIEYEEWFREVGHEVLKKGLPDLPLSRERVMITGKAGGCGSGTPPGTAHGRTQYIPSCKTCRYQPHPAQGLRGNRQGRLYRYLAGMGRYLRTDGTLQGNFQQQLTERSP